MKTLLHSLSFLIAAGYAGAEVAELAGARLPAFVNAENAVTALVATLLLALLLGDYGRKVPAPMTARRVSTGARVATIRRQAYSIRRGAEAARLATPRVVHAFRRTPRLNYERAA